MFLHGFETQLLLISWIILGDYDFWKTNLTSSCSLPQHQELLLADRITSFSWPNSKISLHYTVLHQPRDPSVHRRSHEICAGIGRRKCLIMWLQAGSRCIHTKLYRQRNPDIFWIVTSFFWNLRCIFTFYEWNIAQKFLLNDRRIVNSSLKHFGLNWNSWTKVVFILIYVSSNQKLLLFRKCVSEK